MDSLFPFQKGKLRYYPTPMEIYMPSFFSSSILHPVLKCCESPQGHGQTHVCSAHANLGSRNTPGCLQSSYLHCMLSLKRNPPKSRDQLGSSAGCHTRSQPGRRCGAVLQGLGPGCGLAQHSYQSVCMPANISHNSSARPVHLFFEGCFQLS